MSNEFSIKFPEADLKRFQGLLVRAEKELGKSTKQALQWGFINVARSIGASTKKAPEKRKVYNSWEAQGIDLHGMSKANRKLIIERHKDAPKGVYVFDSKGNPVFRPIEVSSIPMAIFKSKSGRMLAKNMTTGQIKTVDSGFVAQNKVKSKAYRNLLYIKNSGLCKKMWSWLSKQSRQSASNKNLADVNWYASGWAVRVRNMLDYAGLAFAGKGLSPVDTAMARASDSIAKKIETELDKRAKALTA